MYEKLEVCPSCKFTEFKNELIVTDYLVTQESFALVKCKKCQLLFTNPRPELNNLSKYYQSEDYISHKNKGTNLTNIIYKMVRKYTLIKKAKLIRQYQNEGSLLDFGCGTGDFLSKCKSLGWEVNGIEIDEGARSIAAKKISKDNVFTSIDDIKKNKKYDVITAWHVLEHVYDLKQTIKSLKKKLNKEGTLIIAVPNYLSYDSTYYKEFWAGYDVPRHLYHFSKQSFSYLMSKARLSLIDIRPMRFDAYYVSLLSEKYKSGSSSFMKAFIKGYQSNSKAEKTGNFSSLIYVLKK